MRQKKKNKVFAVGPCCCCEEVGPRVCNLVMLDKKSPIPGHGWGCMICDLPSDGALYVCCDGCLEAKREPQFACCGYPATEGRIPIDELTGEHTHDYRFHIRWFTDSPVVGESECRCSLCEQMIDKIPLRIFDREQNQEARFHTRCAEEVGILKR